MAHVITTVNPVRGTNPLIANLAERLTADNTAIRPVTLGFIPSTTGFARVKPALGPAVVDIPTVAGVHCPLDILEFDKTNSTAGQELVILRQGSG